MSKSVNELLLKQKVTNRPRTPAGWERRAKEAWMREIQITLWRARRAGVQYASSLLSERATRAWGR
jgi:hypothetical protein